MKVIDKKNLQELRNLELIEVKWIDSVALSFSLSDGQKCEAGTKKKVSNYWDVPKKVFTKSHTFDSNFKIT